MYNCMRKTELRANNKNVGSCTWCFLQMIYPDHHKLRPFLVQSLRCEDGLPNAMASVHRARDDILFDMATMPQLTMIVT